MSHATAGPARPDAPSFDADFSEAQLQQALQEVGLTSGDIVFVQADLDALGSECRSPSREQRSATVLRALRDITGLNGTIVVPTYTFSFCRGERFDTATTPTGGGPWSPSAEFLEHVRTLPDALRSFDPIHSAAGVGPATIRLLGDLPATCFGDGSLQHRLRREGARLCTLGLDMGEATMVHHAEAMAEVPFRYRKLFTGTVVHNGIARRTGWVYEVRVQAPNFTLDASEVVEEALARGVIRQARIGRGIVQSADAQAFFDLVYRMLERNPWCTVQGPPEDPLVLESKRVPRQTPPVALPPDASLGAIVRTLAPVRRDIVSDGYDAALEALAGLVPMQVHEYPSGTECFTWTVPEKWTCREAWLETLDGRRLFSYADHPLHVVSYSLPFEDEVSRETLFEHLHVHERLPDAIPFVFKYYERDWGLCCSQRMRDRLTDARYRVAIRSEFSYGTLKVGEVVVPGRTDDTIVLCAHLCHPGMAVDDLTGVAVGIGVVQELLRRRMPTRYTYRLLILPETIGSLAYLSRNESLVPRMKGGLFLEMLALGNPHVLQLSHAGDTAVDACFAAAVEEADPDNWTAKYRTLVGNDERQFNAPGVRVPMLALLQIRRPGAPDYPYREYHSSFDTAELVTNARLEASRDLVLKMIAALEADRVPINRFKGEICCSRYGLHVDWFTAPDAHQAFWRILDAVDGTRSVAQIARLASTRVEMVTSVLDRLEQHGLIEYQLPRAEPPSPAGPRGRAAGPGRDTSGDEATPVPRRRRELREELAALDAALRPGETGV